MSTAGDIRVSEADEFEGDEWQFVADLQMFAGQGDVRVMRDICAAPGFRPEMIEATDVSGETPLYRASTRGQLGACELLLQAGADPNRRNCAGHPAAAFGSRAEGGVSAEERARASRLFAAYGLRTPPDEFEPFAVEAEQSRGRGRRVLPVPEVFASEAARHGLALCPDKGDWEQGLVRRGVTAFTLALWLSPVEADSALALVAGLEGRERILRAAFRRVPE